MNALKMLRIITMIAVLIPWQQTVLAHARYLLPSHTNLSGESQYITVLSSISNDIFYPDWALGDNGKGIQHPEMADINNELQYQVTLPSGKLEKFDLQAFARVSVGDVQLTGSGTYRISLFQSATKMVTFNKADGTPWFLWGENPQLPEGATNIMLKKFSSRTDTFVSLNEHNFTATNPSGVGLELRAITHPNDVFVNEKAKFVLTLNGKPVTAGLKIHMTKEGTKHRNQRNEIEVLTNKQGEFEVLLAQAGFYVLEATANEPGKAGSGIAAHDYEYFLTLEVFAQ